MSESRRAFWIVAVVVVFALGVSVLTAAEPGDKAAPPAGEAKAAAGKSAPADKDAQPPKARRKAARGKAGQDDPKTDAAKKGTTAVKEPKKEDAAKETAKRTAKETAKDIAKAPAKDSSKDTAKEAAPAAETKAEKEPSSSASSKKDSVRKPNVMRITLKGSYPEGPQPMGLFSEVRTTMGTLMQRFSQAASEKNTIGVLLVIDDIEIGMGKVHEVRGAIARVRKAGKPVYAVLSGADTRQYMIAAACDEIALAPSGAVLVPGVRAEVAFYKGLLDKLGLKFDTLQMGKYKGAAELFTRTSMSEPLRESIEAIVDDGYAYLVQSIGADRQLNEAEVKELLDQGLFTAKAARRAGLVDQLAYADEVEQSLKRKLKVDDLTITTGARRRRTADEDVSGMGGFMKLMELMMGSKKEETTGAAHKIAVVYAAGTIIEGESASGLFGGSALGSKTLCEALRTADKDPKVAAIVLRVDSPGGSAVASDLIWREIEQIKKPVVASMGDVAASGGYYIAMGARKIFAEPTTITGSIGVVGGKLVVAGLYDKIGITTETIARGRNSGALSSTAPFTPEERKAWTRLLEETYRQFVDKAAKGRKMNREKLEGLAQGRVWSGRAAVKNGLVDALGTLQDALAEAKKLGGIPSDEKVDVMVLPQPKSFFEQMLSEPSTTAPEAFAAASGLNGAPAAKELLQRAATLQRVFAKPAATLLPIDVTLK